LVRIVARRFLNLLRFSTVLYTSLFSSTARLTLVS
jgi:hypothetical protein